MLYTPDDVRRRSGCSRADDLLIDRAERIERPVEADAGTTMAIDCLVRAHRATG